MRGTRLAHLHPLERESRVTFAEDAHVYTVDGQRVPRSVTGLLHSFATDFDSQQIVENMGIKDPEEILRLWRMNGKVKSARGTLLHYHAEQMLNSVPIETPHSPELQQACAVHEYFIGLGLQPFRTEVNVFHNGLRVAGQPDAIYNDEKGYLIIVDWKRVQEIRAHSSFRSLRPPLEHLPDTNLWLYALQLNLYAYILESEYGFTVASMYLAQVHPNLESPRVLPVPRMDDEIQLIEAHEIGQGRATLPRSGKAFFELMKNN